LYLLDFTRKTAREQDVPDTAQFGVDPMSPENFRKQHADDKVLGKATISGVECEGYGIHDPRHKGKYLSEVWYAPSLNYLVMKARARPTADQGQVSFVSDLQAGEEPDPSYFRLPAGFKVVR
jgi:hypothetical protein